MALNDFNVNRIRFQDIVNGNDYFAYVSGGQLYFENNTVLVGTTGNLNTNDLMMITTNLTSGANTQRIYYPVGYEPTTTPKVVYSIIGENETNILGPQLSAVTVDYFELKFTRPVPSEQYYVQATIYKNDDFNTFSGTNVDLNPIRTARSVWVDTVYGHDGGTFSGRRQNPNFPYFSLQAAHDNAVSGDTIFLYPGNYTGVNITKDLNFQSKPKALIDEGTMIVSLGKTASFDNLQIVFKSGSLTNGISVATGATANFYNNNFIQTQNKPAILNSGSVFNYGDLYHNGSINKMVNVHGAPVGYQVNQSTSGALVNYSGVNNLLFFPQVASAVDYAPTNSLIKIASGTYSGFSIDKSLTFEFDKGARISGRIDVATQRNVVFKDLFVDIQDNAILNGGLSFTSNSTGHFYGDNFVKTTNGVAITGSGSIFTYSDLYYNGLVAPTLTFENGLNARVESGINKKGYSGVNGTVYFETIQRAVDLLTGNSKITVSNGVYNGFTYANKPNLTFSFDNATIVSPILLSGNGYKTSFKDVAFSISTGFNYALLIAGSGITGTFKGDSSINVSNVYAQYFITGSGGTSGNAQFSSGILANISTIALSASGYNYYISGNFTETMTGVSGSGLTYFTKSSISGSGFYNLGSTIYNQLPTGGINIIGDTAGYKPNAIFFSSSSFQF